MELNIQNRRFLKTDCGEYDLDKAEEFAKKNPNDMTFQNINWCSPCGAREFFEELCKHVCYQAALRITECTFTSTIEVVKE